MEKTENCNRKRKTEMENGKVVITPSTHIKYRKWITEETFSSKRLLMANQTLSAYGQQTLSAYSLVAEGSIVKC